MASFDVISTEQNGIEVVMLPLRGGGLLLQFKGKEIYVDPDRGNEDTALPAADLVFNTRLKARVPERLPKETTMVISPGEFDKDAARNFGEIQARAIESGYLFTMAGRRIYVSGESLPADIKPVNHVDVAFVSASKPEAAITFIRSAAPRVAYPYLAAAAQLRAVASAVASGSATEVRVRDWS